MRGVKLFALVGWVSAIMAGGGIFSNQNLKKVADSQEEEYSPDDRGIVAGVDSKKKSSSMLIPNIILGAANGLDAYTTQRVLRQNGDTLPDGSRLKTREMYPLMSSNPNINLAEKGLATAGMMYGVNKLAKKDSKGAKIAAYAMSALPALAGINNIRAMKKINAMKSGGAQ